MTHNGESSTLDALAKVNGLVWERGRNYWALVQSDAFNQYAPQTGTYACEALDQNGNVQASDSVTVDSKLKPFKTLFFLRMEIGEGLLIFDCVYYLYSPREGVSSKSSRSEQLWNSSNATWWER